MCVYCFCFNTYRTRKCDDLNNEEFNCQIHEVPWSTGIRNYIPEKLNYNFTLDLPLRLFHLKFSSLIWTYLLECLSIRWNASKAIEIYTLLCIGKDSQQHSLHFHGKSIPLELVVNAKDLFEFVAHSFAYFTAREYNDECPKQFKNRNY